MRVDKILVNSSGRFPRNEEPLDDIMNISRLNHKHSQILHPPKKISKALKNHQPQSKSGASDAHDTHAHDTLTHTYVNDGPEATMRRSKSIALQTVYTFEKRSGIGGEELSTRTMNSESDGEGDDDLLGATMRAGKRVVVAYLRRTAYG